MPRRVPMRTAVLILAAGLGVAGLLARLSPRRAAPPVMAPDPLGPVRSVGEVRDAAATLAGSVVRLRGRITGCRDLNPGQPFPWDVLYTVTDATGSVPVHWFAQQPGSKDRRPLALPGDRVIVTGKVKRELELEGKTYPLVIHEITELHNHERLTLPATPTAR